MSDHPGELIGYSVLYSQANGRPIMLHTDLLDRETAMKQVAEFREVTWHVEPVAVYKIAAEAVDLLGGM